MYRWYTKPSWDTRKVPASIVDWFLASIVPLTYGLPYGEEVFLCPYPRIALPIAR
jgi:hypothetical protein